MRVGVAEEEEHLKKEQTRRPHARPATEPRENVFADQRLDLEKQKRTKKNGQRPGKHAADFACDWRGTPVRFAQYFHLRSAAIVTRDFAALCRDAATTNSEARLLLPTASAPASLRAAQSHHENRNRRLRHGRLGFRVRTRDAPRR